MPPDVKIFGLEVLPSKKIRIEHFKPVVMPLDVTILDLEVLGSKNIQTKGFNIQGPCPPMLKI